MIVTIIMSEYEYNAIYLDDVLYDQAEILGEGDNLYYLLQLAEEKGFTYSDIKKAYCNDEGNDYLADETYYPEDLNDFKQYIYYED